VDEGKLLLSLAMHLALTGLPLVAAMLVAARLGVRQVPVLLAIGLAVSGAAAMLVFWAFYGRPIAGKSLAYFVAFGSILLIVLSLHGGRLDRTLLRRLATPMALWVLGSAFLVFLGYLHGGSDTPLGTAATRFATQLPSDNNIPMYFSEWFFEHGHYGGRPPEFPGEWLSSDRPPLQVGYLLSQRTFGWGGAEFDYQVLGVILQQLWIVGLWALLLAARLGRVTRALAMVTVLLSDIAIVHGFFVWPKLLPAAMLLAAAALVVTPLWAEIRRSLWGAVLVATLLALAMLGHGSTVFGAIPLLLIAAFRGLPSWRWVGVAALVGIVAMAPWSAYQKYGDPPGNRLVKWQIAGAVDVDSRGIGETLVDSYSEAGIGGTLHNKGQNLVTMVGGGPMVTLGKGGVEALDGGDLDAAVASLRGIFFLYLLPSLGLLLVAPLAMVAARKRGRRRPEDWSFALTCWAVFAIGAVGWALLMFGNEAARTVIHQGSYLLPILGLCAAVAGLRATFPRFAIWFAGVAALLMLALYVPSLTPPEGTSYSLLAALLTAIGLAGFVLVALRGDPAGAEPAEPALPARD
jgi:hypothetical protein